MNIFHDHSKVRTILISVSFYSTKLQIITQYLNIIIARYQYQSTKSFYHESNYFNNYYLMLLSPCSSLLVKLNEATLED